MTHVQREEWKGGSIDLAPTPEVCDAPRRKPVTSLGRSRRKLGQGEGEERQKLAYHTVLGVWVNDAQVGTRCHWRKSIEKE